MKRAAAVFGLAIAGAQAGHLLTYQLRFGPLAQQVQSTGVHAYFPSLAKTLLGSAALVLIASLFLIGLARVVAGRRIDKASAPSLLQLLSALYTLQLALFVTQEAIEGSPAGDLFLWGLLGQLPIAFAGAVALRWFLARLEPVIASIFPRIELVLDVTPAIRALGPAPLPQLIAPAPVSIPVTRRGPPPTF